MDSDAKKLGHVRAVDSKDRLGLPKVKRNHTFLRWQQYSQSKICLRLAC